MASNQHLVLKLGALLLLGCLLLPSTSAAQSSDSTTSSGSSEVASENPFAGQDAAIQEGQELFQSYNCYACHGRQGGGGMGPSLRDSKWRYGSTDADLYASIHDGRPGGMLGFGDKLSKEEIWKLVAFVRTFTQSSSGE